MASVVKHTPAPWWRDDDGFVAAGHGDTYRTLADFDCSTDIDIDEREANKALAIAAPELLSAAKAALFVLNIVYQREPGTNEAGAIAGLESAIAKAQIREVIAEPIDDGLFDCTQAITEGWGIFESVEHGWHIEKDDDSDIFPSDEEAAIWVYDQAQFDSAYHKAALAWLEQANREG